jgi:hypothetical protein
MGCTGDKSVSPNEGSDHAGEIAACCEPPQPSCCRPVARVAISEIPKTNRTAKLMTIMMAKGMFSRYRILAPPQSIEHPNDKTFDRVLVRRIQRNNYEWGRSPFFKSSRNATGGLAFCEQRIL